MGEDKCVVCLQGLLTPGLGRQSLECGHVFHEKCILDLRRYGGEYNVSGVVIQGPIGRCPVCHAQTDDISSVSDLMVQAALCQARNQFSKEATLLAEVLHIEPNHDLAACALSRLYDSGLGVEKNIGKALELCERAHDNVFPAGTFNLATTLLRVGDTSRPMHLLEQAYQQTRDIETSARAAWLLGTMLVNGEEVPRNVNKGVEILQYAHDAGSAEATCCLGSMFMEGSGGVHDVPRGLKFLKQSHRAGCLKAMYLLGVYYAGWMKRAKGKPDIPRAHALLQEAAVQGQVEAQYVLSMFDPSKCLTSNALNQTDGSSTSSASTSIRCANCGSTGSAFRCSGCHHVKYCSVRCQSKDWKSHAGVMASSSEAAKGILPSNAQVSNAILRSCFVESSTVLLEFSRDPKSFHQALLNCTALSDCRTALQEHGYSAELPSQAKIFVPPHLFEPCLEAVRLAGHELKPRHVLVTTDLEGAVMQAVKEPGNPSKVRCKSRRTVPLGLGTAACDIDAPVVIRRTFIEVRLASSLHSAPSSAPVTASTTDARGIQNPRSA